MIDKNGKNWRMARGSKFEQEVFPLMVKHEVLDLWKNKKSFMHILSSQNTGDKNNGN